MNNQWPKPCRFHPYVANDVTLETVPVNVAKENILPHVCNNSYCIPLWFQIPFQHNSIFFSLFSLFCDKRERVQSNCNSLLPLTIIASACVLSISGKHLQLSCLWWFFYVIELLIIFVPIYIQVLVKSNIENTHLLIITVI